MDRVDRKYEPARGGSGGRRAGLCADVGARSTRLLAVLVLSSRVAAALVSHGHSRVEYEVVDAGERGRVSIGRPSVRRSDSPLKADSGRLIAYTRLTVDAWNAGVVVAIGSSDTRTHTVVDGKSRVTAMERMDECAIRSTNDHYKPGEGSIGSRTPEFDSSRQDVPFSGEFTAKRTWQRKGPPSRSIAMPGRWEQK